MTQETALKILKTGRNVFITGSAGSGKTHLVRRYISWLDEQNIKVGITASTGIAATHMNGITIHAWSGIGIKDHLTQSEISHIAEKSYLKNRIKKTEVLIMDEVSMLHDFRLDMVDAVVREIKGDDRPFGGMQVVLVGDFFQLPPIGKRRETNPELWQEEKMSEFVYHSRAWKALDLAICYLSEQYRQEDKEFVDILNSIRSQEVDEKTKAKLQKKVVKEIDTGTVHTQLFARNINVDKINDEELNKIKGEELVYYMENTGPDALVGILEKSCLAPSVLRLKEGAKVMFVKNNYDLGFVNGTQGIVRKCDKKNIYVETKNGDMIEVERMDWTIEDDGKVKAKVSQYPLRLAWAITIHKSQGMSLDSALIDLRDSFEKGMGYVALSRLRSLSGLYLLGINDKAFALHEEAFSYDTKWQEESSLLSGMIESMNNSDIEKAQEDFVRSASSKYKEKKKDTKEITLEMLLEGKDLKEIARERNLTLSTILEHTEYWKEKDPSVDIYHLRKMLPATAWKNIWSAFQKVGIVDGHRPLRPVMDVLKNKYPYEDLRIVRLFL